MVIVSFRLVAQFSFSFYKPLLSRYWYHWRFIGEFMCILWNRHSCFGILVHSSQWTQMFSWLTMLITFIVYMIYKKVSLNLYILVFNRSEQMDYVNYVTLNSFAIFLRRVYLCERCKLCFFVMYVPENAFYEVRLFIQHCLSLYWATTSFQMYGIFKIICLLSYFKVLFQLN